LTEPLRASGGPTLFGVLDHCATGMGSRRLRQWLHHPLRDPAQAAARHDLIDGLLAAEALDPAATLLRGIADIDRIAARIALKTVRPRELAALRDAAPQVSGLAQLVGALPLAHAAALAVQIGLPPGAVAQLGRALLPEPASAPRDGDVVAPGFDAELDELRALRDDSGRFLLDLEARERARTGIANLRVEYNRVHGFYIEVTHGQAARVPIDYRRRQTLKNAERYITPELKAYEDRALSAQERARQRERTLYDELVAGLGDQVSTLLRSAEALGTLDALAALARHAHTAGWVRPQLAAEAGLAIEAARHPVVERELESYVPNHCHLGSGRRLLVITGPNMGGKSTYMRSVALIALLAWCGSFVPASRARIGPIDRIMTRIGAADDLARGASTFMVEMTEAAAILNHATPHSLVLMDEIGRGTSTFDGLALAIAIARELAERNRSLTLFATHYFELTGLAQALAEVANVHVGAAEIHGKVVFLHEVRDGPASRSYGLAVAQLAGIAPRVVRQARRVLEDLEQRAAAGQHDRAQLDLFAAQPSTARDDGRPVEPGREPTLSPDAGSAALRARLGAIDVDGLTPRDALQLLYELKQLLAQPAGAPT
jgi:DNA mismatch repair protein MutS